MKLTAKQTEVIRLMNEGYAIHSGRRTALRHLQKPVVPISKLVLNSMFEKQIVHYSHSDGPVDVFMLASEYKTEAMKIKLSDVQRIVIDRMKEGEKIFYNRWCESAPSLSQSGITVACRTFTKLKAEGLIELEGSTAVKRIYVLTSKGKEA